MRRARGRNGYCAPHRLARYPAGCSASADFPHTADEYP
ncbi:hypothetical protein MYA_2307 [Burkholderia sp. KJ006]|nr:hypothetical protein MYA_2307 [Burkholderia sp. KJ006]